MSTGSGYSQLGEETASSDAGFEAVKSGTTLLCGNALVLVRKLLCAGSG